ncbi:MAG: hypothetical protein ACO25F_10940 [Erythrobacter sp.]
MQKIQLPPDKLDELSRSFEQRPLRESLFLNSVPKSGSHLLRNIVRMFVPVEHQYKRDFIQYAALKEHLPAFDGPPALLSWGHLFFSDISAIATSKARKILLVRDPYTWVLAKARFLMSNEFTGELDFLKTAPTTVDDLINMMIFGLHRTNPSLHDIYTHNAVAWLGTGVFLVRYEELAAAARDPGSDPNLRYFRELFDACGIDLPDDWIERVRIGADPANSGTASQNLTGRVADVPRELSSLQKKLVDFASPGLRELLGYA